MWVRKLQCKFEVRLRNFLGVRESGKGDAATVKPIESPPPRPNRKPLHLYPRKVSASSKAIEKPTCFVAPYAGLPTEDNGSPTSEEIGERTYEEVGEDEKVHITREKAIGKCRLKTTRLHDHKDYRQIGDIPPQTIKSLMYQLCEGVAFCHVHGR